MSQDKKNKKNEINSEKAAAGQNYVYHNPAEINGQQQFPIIASGIVYPYNQDVIPLNDLKEIHNGGFNLALKFIATEKLIRQSLNNAISARVKLFLGSGVFYSNSTGIKATIDNYADAFAGINLIDEPYFNELSECTEDQCEEKPEIQKSALIVRYNNLMGQITDQNLNCLVYINLPAYGGDSFYESAPGNTKKERYNYYLNVYEKYYMPSFFSYDLYPIWEYTKLLYYGLKPNPSEQEGEIKVDDNFYENLELYMSLSRNTYNRDNKNVPFWAFCQGISYMKLEEAQFKPIALEQYLRFEAFNALAYGAQGIVYWRYAMDPTNSGESYFSALLDRRGKRTASWYYARKVNQEIQEYGSRLANSKVLRINDVIYNNPLVYSHYNSTIKINLKEIYKHGCIVSELQVEQFNYVLMIVNKDPLNYKNISLEIQTGTITVLTPAKSKGIKNQILNIGKYDRTLIPGGYMILEFPLPGIGGLSNP